MKFECLLNEKIIIDNNKVILEKIDKTKMSDKLLIIDITFDCKNISIYQEFDEIIKTNNINSVILNLLNNNNKIEVINFKSITKTDIHLTNLIIDNNFKFKITIFLNK